MCVCVCVYVCVCVCFNNNNNNNHPTTTTTYPNLTFLSLSPSLSPSLSLSTLTNHQSPPDWAQPMVLRGHQGRVNCLLYPYGESIRYDMAHLVSGGMDFSICVWDMYTGQMVHRFVVQAGQVLQLLVPPPSCTVCVGLGVFGGKGVCVCFLGGRGVFGCVWGV